MTFALSGERGDPVAQVRVGHFAGVTCANVPSEATSAIVTWVRSGGTVMSPENTQLAAMALECAFAHGWSSRTL